MGTSARWKVAAGAVGLAVLAGGTAVVAANLGTSDQAAEPGAAAPSASASAAGQAPSPAAPPAAAETPQMEELPGGGYTIFDDKVYVALYGHPTLSVLGILGEQGPAKTVKRAKELAATYQPHTKRQVIPSFEVITTIASEWAGRDGDYSDETPLDELWPTVKAARRNGVYVVLDLQPGRTDFLTQAKRYRALLREPHVGLALDPEWRLEPWQVHLRQLGSVDASEVNEVIDWLAGLTKRNGLPQKMLLLHQFRPSMITNRDKLDTDRDEIAVVIQMDGFGPKSHKYEAWDLVRQDAPDNVVFGWKNFIDEDSPMFTPEQTMKVRPQPRWVSFQ